MQNYEDTYVIGYLNNFCAGAQLVDHKIRFVGIADYAGKLQASFYRKGLVPLMDKKETEQYALQTVFRARTRGGFKPQLGEQRYTTTVYDKLIRSTVEISHPNQEFRSMYLLISLEVGCDYPTIIEKKIIPYVSENQDILFERTRNMSEQYADKE